MHSLTHSRRRFSFFEAPPHGTSLWRTMALLIAITVSLPTSASAQDRRIDLSDLAALVNLGDPQISPAGRSIVLLVSRPNYDENRFDGQLVLVDVSTGTQRTLTHHRPRVRYPRWSPMGGTIAFLAADDDNKPQLHIMPVDGGEARRITDAAEGVTLFAWRPNGEDVAFVTPDEREPRTDDEKHNKSFVVGDHDYLATAAPMPSHLWLVSANGGDAERLTSGIEGVSIYAGSPIDWSPDGTRLAFVTQPQPHSGQQVRTSIKVLEVGSGQVRTLVAGPSTFNAPSFSPDGEFIAYSQPDGPGPWWYPHNIYLVPVSGGTGDNLTEAIDRTFYGAQWMPDGQRIVVGSSDHTTVSLWLQPMNSPHRRLQLGVVQPSEVNVGPAGAIAFIGTQPQQPEELYYMATPDSPPAQLTQLNASVASQSLGTVESITWDGPDGFAENGVLVLPPDFREDGRYPLVLVIHGGPMGTSTEGFSVLPQLLAAQGWVVFSPNYRGSDNMGREFQTGVVDDAGEGPGRDVMAGIAAVKARGFIDDERVAVSGWSYGGYMTTWLISHFRGWRSAVAGAAVTDYADSYNLSDLNIGFGYGFKGSPWLDDNAEIWREQTPITYVQNIQTPTLILSNTGDLRVPITQSYKLYRALKENGVEVEFIAYPIPGHFPGDPVHQRDVYRRWVEWIELHFKDPATDPD